MTTLVITNDFPPRIGGIESFVAEACRMLDHQVVVLTSEVPGAERFDADLPYPVVRFGGPILLPTPAVGRRAVELLRRHEGDRVLYGAAAPLGLLAPTLRRAGAVRQIGLTHGHEVWWATLPGSRQLLRRIGDSVDQLGVISDFTAQRIGRALSPRALNSLINIPPPVDLDLFSPGVDLETPDDEARRMRCVAVGRFVVRKGFDVLLQAWRLVLDDHRDHGPLPALELIGDGPRRRHLERLVQELGLGEQVIMTGSLGRDAVAQRLRQADVFVLPMRTRLAGLEPEGLGLAALEAAASGLPVIIGNSGGAPETVQHAVSGFVVDPRDRFAIATRLTSLLRDPAMAQRMGAAGRQLVAERFSTTSVRAQLRRALDLPGTINPETINAGG